MNGRWFVITGGPSTGKTTLISELAKIGFDTVGEAAREIIDKGLKNGKKVKDIRVDEKRFQEEVTRLKESNEAKCNKEAITFFDRGMHDSEAYLKYYGFKVEEWVKDLTKKSKYTKVFLLAPLADYKEDYARVESDDFKNKIQTILYETYSKYGLVPRVVPDIGLKGRVDYILKEAGIKND